MEKAETKYANLFSRLDTNKDGRLDMAELRAAMKSVGLGKSKDEVTKFFERSDVDKNMELDVTEFVTYMLKHENEIRLAFNNLDRNKDGTIDADEIVQSFRDLGVEITGDDAKSLLERLDKDHTLKIEWEEWRQFLMFQSASSIQDILHNWRHSTVIDIGENALIPDDFTEKELKTGMWWRQLVAGGVAGAVSRTATAPLDRLKVLLQVHGPQQKMSIASGFKHMLQEGGVTSLWRGNGMNVVKIAPESALKFMFYEQYKSLIKGDSKRELNVYDRLLAGSAAGATAQTIIYPMEVMKTRLAIRKTGQYKGMLDCAMQIYKSEGIKSFYKGYLPNILGIIPYAGIDLAIYETLRRMYCERHKKEDPGVLVLLTCGTASSTCGQITSYPLALVRTRLQAQAALGKDQKQQTMMSMFRSIVKHEGPRGLYRGIVPNFLKVAPAVSIGYVIYERTRTVLGINKK